MSLLGLLRRAVRGIALFASSSCAVVDEEQGTEIVAQGETEDAISASEYLSANGSYGAGCTSRSGTWSVAFVVGAPLDNPALTLVSGNTGCQLTLTGLRTGTGSTNLYTYSPGIALTTSYAASNVTFTNSGGATHLANAKLSASGFSANFLVQVSSVQDATSHTHSGQAYYAYDADIKTTSGLVSYWRLGEAGAFMSDSFTDTAGTELRSHGATNTWLWHGDSDANDYAYINSAGRLHAINDQPVVYYGGSAMTAPASADYAVEGTVYIASLLDDDQSAVMGRATSTSANYYSGGYGRSSGAGRWELQRGDTLLGSVSSAVTAGTSYRVTLELRGTRIRMLVDGVEMIAKTDATLTSAGKPGLRLARAGGTADPSATAGLHLDDIIATPLAADGYGTNHGVYVRGVTMGATGALASSSNKAATFDGVNDFIEVDRAISDDFSIELWFKSTQGIGTGTHWYNGAGLVDADTAGVANDFGISLRSDGRVAAGVGNSDTTILSTQSGFNNGAWHQVVLTRVKSTGAMILYVDGQQQGTATGSIQSLTASSKLNIGRIRTGTNYFAGSIDEVSVYSSALSAATVLRHYQAGVRP